MIKVVVPVSGGKDSQACLKLAFQSYEPQEILGLFCDTQFEHPLTYSHIQKLNDLYHQRIVTLCAGSVPEKVRQFKRFPGGGARHCTSQLKIEPSIKFYNQLATEQNSGFEVWYGMRAEESPEREKRYQGKTDTDLYAPHELMSNYPKYLAKMGVMFRLPVIDFSTKEIFDLLGDEVNPLYGKGFARVGCFPCLASGDRWKEKAFSFDETGAKHYAIVQQLEVEIGKSIFTSKGGSQRNNKDQIDLFQGCAVCAI